MSHIKEYRCLNKSIHHVDKKWTVAPFSNFYGKIRVGFILKLIAEVLLKNGTRDFENSPPFERFACFFVRITGKFQRFQYFNLKQFFWKKAKPFPKNWSTVFHWKVPRLTRQHFHSIRPCQKPISRQRKRGVQNIASNHFIYLKILRARYKELVWCTNQPNFHTRTFPKRWRFIWGCFFPVSYLNTLKFKFSVSHSRSNCQSENGFWNMKSKFSRL